MDDRKKVVLGIIGIIVLVIALLGTTYAFFEATSNGAAVRNINVHAHTVDTLTFSVSDNISFETNQDNFIRNGINQSGEATATAVLTPNSKTGSATDHYYLSLYLKENTTVYSASNINHDPEYLLQVFDSLDNLVTLNNLGTQKTVGTLTGYDITGKSGIFTLLNNHAITASNNTSTTETWRVVITAINHNFNQNENAGSIINGKLLVNKTGFDYCAINPNDCISLAVANIPETVGKTVTPSCNTATATWSNKYNQLEVSGVSSSKLDCTLTYSDATGTTPLNTYLTSLSGTTQGDGKMVHEIFGNPDYENTSVIKTFGTTPVYFSNTSNSSTTQDVVDSYWTFDSTTGVFTSDPSSFNNGTTFNNGNYLHAYAKVPEAGYYQICFSFVNPQGRLPNSFNIAINTTLLTSVDLEYSYTQSGCLKIGYFSAADYLNISQRNDNNSDKKPVITFRIEKFNDVLEVDTGYRYEGKNPNNYVMFNNELWRILGVFSTEYDSNNDGTTDTTANLVKIIRDESIGGLIWNNTSANNWPNSSLYHLLNEQYYDWNTNKATIGTYCYGYSNVPSNCDYSIKGIQDGYRNMIVKAKWYLGGGKNTSNITYDPDSIYSNERDANNIYSGNSASTPGYIGLMYESDYLYGALASDCARYYYSKEHSYGNANCAGKNWLYGMEQWTITPSIDIPMIVFSVLNYGDVSDSSRMVYHSSLVRPVLYLSSSVYKVGGSGTTTDPYIIGM